MELYYYSVKAASELSSSFEDEVVHFAVNASNSLEKLWNAEKAADVSILMKDLFHTVIHIHKARFAVFVCLFNWSLHAETHLGPDGAGLEQNAQARLKTYISMLANWSMEM